MEVDIMFVKLDGEERTEIPYSSMAKEEQEEQGRRSAVRFFESLGYTPKGSTA